MAKTDVFPATSTGPGETTTTDRPTLQQWVSTADSDSPRVGYILKQYPRLSETFVLNEILGLEEAGVETSIFSLRHATEGRFHPAISQVRGKVFYVSAIDKSGFLQTLRDLPGLRVDRLNEVLDFVDLLPTERRPRVLINAMEVATEAVRAGVDHLHAHFLTVAAHTAHIVSLLTGLPYSVTAHAKDIYRTSVDWEIAARVATNATAVVTVCDANLHFLRHRLDGTETGLTRIYNGLGPQLPPTPEAHNPGLLLGVGRLVEKKGFDLLLDAVAELAPKHPQLQLVLLGDGDCRGGLEDQARRLGIVELVTFAGSTPQDEVAQWMRRADVLVAPCRVGTDGNQDALPTVLIEALGAGLPSVTTPVAGIPEIITHGQDGLIVACDDVSALAGAIGSLLESPTKRAALSAAGPAKLADRFDRTITIKQLIETFDIAERVR